MLGTFLALKADRMTRVTHRVSPKTPVEQRFYFALRLVLSCLILYWGFTEDWW